MSFSRHPKTSVLSLVLKGTENSVMAAQDDIESMSEVTYFFASTTSTYLLMRALWIICRALGQKLSLYHCQPLPSVRKFIKQFHV